MTNSLPNLVEASDKIPPQLLVLMPLGFVVVLGVAFVFRKGINFSWEGRDGRKVSLKTPNQSENVNPPLPQTVSETKATVPNKAA